MGRWSRLVAPLLVEFAAIADTGRVLDVGTGTGSLTTPAWQRAAVHLPIYSAAAIRHGNSSVADTLPRQAPAGRSQQTLSFVC